MSVIKTGIEVDTNSSFNDPMNFEEEGAVSSVSATGLTSETTYYTRAYVVDELGNIYYSENTENFTTAVAPGIDYFYVENVSSSTLHVTVKRAGSPSMSIYYSLNGVDFTLCTFNSNNDCVIDVNNLGDKVYFRGDQYFLNDFVSIDAYFISGDRNHSIGGDLNTLSEYNGSSSRYAGIFGLLFSYDTFLVDASNLKLSNNLNPNDGYHYYNLFNGCSALTSIKAPNIDPWNPNHSFDNWVSGVSATGTMYCPAGVTIPTGNNGIPSGWTRIDY